MLLQRPRKERSRLMRCSGAGLQTCLDEDTSMNNSHMTLRQRLRAGVVLAAALLLVTGATWRGISAASQTATARASTPVAAPVARAVSGGRDSYADVVNAVAPAVVTIH